MRTVYKLLITSHFSGSLKIGFGSSSLPAASLLVWILSLSSSLMIGVRLLVSMEARVASTNV